MRISGCGDARHHAAGRCRHPLDRHCRGAVCPFFVALSAVIFLRSATVSAKFSEIVSFWPYLPVFADHTENPQKFANKSEQIVNNALEIVENTWRMI